MTAVATLRKVKTNHNETNTRISTGLKVRAAKENAAKLSISSTMKGDSGRYKAINEGLTLAKNSVSTNRLGAKRVQELTKQFTERVAFAQGNGVDKAAVTSKIKQLTTRIPTIINQSTFNGDDLVTGASSVTVVTRISCSSGSFSATTINFQSVDLQSINDNLVALATVTAITGVTAASASLLSTEKQLETAIEASTSLGVTEKSIETQKEFLTALADEIEVASLGWLTLKWKKKPRAFRLSRPNSSWQAKA